jgi:hypothetical protein
MIIITLDIKNSIANQVWIKLIRNTSVLKIKYSN